jgi:hypothetical protein
MNSLINTEIIDLMTEMKNEVFKRNAITIRTGKTIKVKLQKKKPTKLIIVEDEDEVVVDAKVEGAKANKTQVFAQLLDIFPAFAENREMMGEDRDAPAPAPVVVAEEIPEDVPIAQLIVAKKTKKSRKPKPMVAVEVVVANTVRTFWFPEEVWAIIKSYLDFGKKYCSNSFHDGTGSLKMYCVPSVKIVEDRALKFLKNADGERVFHEDAIKMKIEKKWVCECCLKTLGRDGSTLASHNSFDECVENHRMVVLAIERQDWYRERHPNEDFKKALGAGKRHTTILRKRYWTEWSMEANLADLQTYWGRFLLHRRRDQNRQREALINEIDRFNEYQRGKIVAKERKEAFIRELNADFASGTLEYVAFTKLMRTTLTHCESSFRHDDWRQFIIRQSNLNAPDYDL